LSWSFARSMPVAKLSGIGVLIGIVLQRCGDTRPLRQRENVLMVVLFVLFTLSSLFAFYPDRAWPKWQEVSKIILMALVTSTMLTDRKRLRYFLLVVALSLGFYGARGGIFTLLTGGNYRVWGPGGDSSSSIIGANNALGVALNMCLPMLWYLSKDQQSVWLKGTLLLWFFLTIPAIMFTYSRASALALGVVLIGIILKEKKKGLAIGLMLAVGVIGVNYIPEKWYERQQSTLEYQ